MAELSEVEIAFLFCKIVHKILFQSGTFDMLLLFNQQDIHMHIHQHHQHQLGVGCGMVVVEVAAAAAIDFYIDRDARLAFSSEILLSQTTKKQSAKIGWSVLICYFVKIVPLAMPRL
ncbi:hypothetical protein T4D_8314 [Trichinella pseudospiralis]|uniref:Uncharacterized protein n=1 Tax=Trichinella pseudospiralis TaxID=6337 RepID=A0A0V1FZ54_TRIPS|nr:hypothetical protein T4D_8314 [Trichinella pseudospiralis]